MSLTLPTQASVANTHPYTVTINNTVISDEVFRERIVTWTLIEEDGECVLESDCGDGILSPSADTEQFNEVCLEILEANAELKGEVYPPQPEGVCKVFIIDGDSSNITLNHHPISPDVFESKKVEWVVMDREELIECLQFQIKHEEILEADEAGSQLTYPLKTLKTLTDKIVITNLIGNQFLTASLSPNKWNKACEEILETDESA